MIFIAIEDRIWISKQVLHLEYSPSPEGGFVVLPKSHSM